jgi:hypothetical protein
VINDRRGDLLPRDLWGQENLRRPAGWFDLVEEERAKALHASAEAHLDAEFVRTPTIRGLTTTR